MTATILMTDPAHFEIRYAINPWMRPSEWLSNPAGHKQSARLAWDGLRSALSEADASIEVVPAAAGWPDMVFPANAAVVLNGSALLARFRHPERQGEQPAFRAALERLVRRGLLHDIAELPAGLIHEGAGDCVWDAARKIFWAGYGPRSDSEAADAIALHFRREVVALELATPRFYHLDTCFCPLSGGEVLFYPPAFTTEAVRRIRERVAPDLLIEAAPDEAAAFCVNAVNLGRTVVMAKAPPRLRAILAERCYRVSEIDLAPFILSGGGAFCMTLRLDLRTTSNPYCRSLSMNAAVTLEHPSAHTAADLIAAESLYGARNYKPLDVVLTRGEGAYVWDVEGRRFLDCLSAYSAVNQGHCHPKILAALIDQASRLTLTSRAFRNDQLPLFYEELCALTRSHKALPMNSGAEAVETALKVARKWGYDVKGVPDGEAEIIVCDGNFHGRTLAIVGFSTDPGSRNGFGPFPPGFRVVPFGDTGALERAITPNTIAFLVEPIQGEAGVIIPPAGYLKAARDLCTRYNIILILDEIQTGLGRTGRLLAEEHEGVEADLTLVGKALGGGFLPVSAVLSNNDVLGVLKPGEHGSTFGGNPLACAVARAALKVLVEEGMIENADAMGARLMAALRYLGSDVVKEVRGRGLLIAIELTAAAGGARAYCERLAARGLLCKETHENVIRIAPPLIITPDQADWIAEQFAAVLGSDA
jgi:ornithine--oxo-acid transaminase